jgi:predicted nucleotidyltransferase
MEEEIDLGEIADLLTKQFTSISALYLFGSRVYGTGSTRSDIDVLVETTSNIKPADMRRFINKHCKALDLFIIDNGKAISVQNESYVEETNLQELLTSLKAQKFWQKNRGRIEIKANWKQKIRNDIDFIPSCLPHIPDKKQVNINPSNLTLNEILKSLTTPQLYAIISVIVFVLMSTFGGGYWLASEINHIQTNHVSKQSNKLNYKEIQKIQIEKAEIIGTEFDEKRAKLNLEIELDPTKRTEGYIQQEECINLVNYQEPYFLEKKDYKEKIANNSIKTCKKAIEYNKNDLYFSFLLSIAYHKNQDYNSCISQLTKTAKLGEKISQRKLGILYLTGNLVEKDTKLAKTWLKKAAENGDKAAKDIIDNDYYEIKN